MAATALELEPLRARLEGGESGPGTAWPSARLGRLEGRSVVLAESGIGVAAAAAATAVLAERHGPSACIVIGIGGTYAGSFVPIGSAVVASEERFLDLGVVTLAGGERLRTLPLPPGLQESPSAGPLPTDPAWRDALVRACGIEPVPFATSDGISGDLDVAASRSARSGAAIESMEGAGAALVCLHTSLPFAEVRGVSNVAGQRDKETWEIGPAVDAASKALLLALRHGPA